MSEKEKDQDKNVVENTEIEPLSDDDLDSVAGGAVGTDGCSSDECPSDGCPSDGCPSDGCPIAPTATTIS